MPVFNLNRNILKKLDDTGIQLNINTYNVIEQIDSLCDWALEFRVELKELIESFLSFLEQQNFGEDDITKKVLRVYKKYFSKI